MSTNPEMATQRRKEKILNRMRRHKGACITFVEILSSDEISEIGEISVETAALSEYLESDGYKGYSGDTHLTAPNGDTVYLAITEAVPYMPETAKALKDACAYFGESDVQIEEDADGNRYCVIPHFRKDQIGPEMAGIVPWLEFEGEPYLFEDDRYVDLEREKWDNYYRDNPVR